MLFLHDKNISSSHYIIYFDINTILNTIFSRVEDGIKGVDGGYRSYIFRIHENLVQHPSNYIYRLPELFL